MAQATIKKWWTQYTLALEKITSLFKYTSSHLEIYRSFCDVVHPFWAKYEDENLANFDKEMKYLDDQVGIGSHLVGKELMIQTDDLVNISTVEERGRQFANQDDMIHDNWMFCWS